MGRATSQLGAESFLPGQRRRVAQASSAARARAPRCTAQSEAGTRQPPSQPQPRAPQHQTRRRRPQLRPPHAPARTQGPAGSPAAASRPARRGAQRLGMAAASAAARCQRPGRLPPSEHLPPPARFVAQGSALRFSSASRLRRAWQACTERPTGRNNYGNCSRVDRFSTHLPRGGVPSNPNSGMSAEILANIVRLRCFADERGGSGGGRRRRCVSVRRDDRRLQVERSKQVGPQCAM